MKVKRFIGDIWKEGRNWKVQYPKEVIAFKRKREASFISEVIIRRQLRLYF